MKKVSRNKRDIAVAIFIAFSVGINPVVMANDIKPTVPVELKFVGNVDEKLLFQLNFTGNLEESEFTIIITDEEGNRLYREVLKGQNFSKRYLLNTEEIWGNELRFEVSSSKSYKTAVFKVNRQARLVENVVVNKLK